MAWITPPNKRLTANFTTVEAACHHCGQVPSVDVITETAEWLENVRQALGGQVMRINSWCRCGAWNQRVGGAPNSYHIKGMAVDFVLNTLSIPTTQKRCKALQSKGLIGGLGTYRNWTHVDCGPRRSWNGP